MHLYCILADRPPENPPLPEMDVTIIFPVVLVSNFFNFTSSYDFIFPSLYPSLLIVFFNRMLMSHLKGSS